MKNFPEEVCSRESWLYLIFSYRDPLTVGFGVVAAANPLCKHRIYGRLASGERRAHASSTSIPYPLCPSLGKA